MCDYAHIQEHNKKLIQFGRSQSARVPLKMVLLKVLLFTFVSCQVINYGRATSLMRPLRRYGRMGYNASNWHHRRLSPFDLRSFSTTQRPVQLATVNKEYGNKLKKSEIKPNTFSVWNMRASWYVSYAFCESTGMILASPQNTLQMQKLQAVLEVFDDSTDESGYWLGGRRNYDIHGNDFYWEINGKKIDDELWLPSKPSAHEGEDCVEFKYSYDGMKLNNFHCVLNRRFVCQVVNHDEYIKNDRSHQIRFENFTRKSHESHHEIKKIGNEAPAGASGKENSSTMTTTTNARTSVTSHETNTTATSTTTTSTTTTTPTTTTTEKYYSDTPHLSVIEDPFTEYEEFY